MGVIVLVSYEPKKGKEQELDALLKKHVPTLQQSKLATERDPIIMKNDEGLRFEIFEWVSQEAVDKAHEIPEVKKLWEELEDVSDMVAPCSVINQQTLFPEFSPIK